MEFTQYLREQLCLHPSMQAQDVVKMCYQAAFGAEHLLTDPESAWVYLEKEYSAADARPGTLYEHLSDEVSRVSLTAWKAEGLPLRWLFRMFVGSAALRTDSKEKFLSYLDEAQQFLSSGESPISLRQWIQYRREYENRGMPAVHHSEAYRAGESPAYRIVNRRFLRLLPILRAAAARTERPVIIAIDGRAASGKSTMAGQLADILGADVVHMDDFFLPPALRTKERFSTPGNNVHHERFCEEVLPYLRDEHGFSYRRFDCSRMDYAGENTAAGMDVRIVEGSYALHPSFGDYADIAVFSDVTPAEQMRRIAVRNGEAMAKMFESRWIPMEEAYFTEYGIREKADIRV